MSAWNDSDPRVLRLPSGRMVRGRGLWTTPDIAPDPDFGVYLLSGPLATAPTWPHLWVEWPDFGVPVDTAQADSAVRQVWDRCVSQRVEVACMGGIGRTGTFLACLAVLDGLAPEAAVHHVRAGYDTAAVETLTQRQFIAAFAARNVAS